MKKYLWILFAALGFAAAACSDGDTPPPPLPPGPTDVFSFEETEITTRTADIRITPQDVTAPYVALYVSEQLYVQYEETFTEQVFAEFELSKVQVADQLSVGPKDMKATGMQPDANYVLAVFGCTAEGEVTTEVFTHSFTTRDKAATQVDVKFEFEINDLVPSGATIRVTPSNNDVVYAVFAGEDAIIQTLGGDLMLAAQYMITYAESDGQIDWSNFDSSKNIRKGAATLNYQGLLSGDRNQAVMAFAVNKWGEVISEVGCKYFRTPAPEPSSCVFDFDIRNLTFNSVDVTITPSERVTYYADVAKKSFMADMNDEEFMNYMMTNYGLQSLIPYEVTEHGGLEPDTEYVVFGFASTAGCATTRLFKEEFRSPAFNYKSGGGAWVDQEVWSVMDGALYNSPGFGIMDVYYTPNDQTVEYFAAMPPMDEESAWFTLSEDDLKKQIILYPYSNDHSSDNHYVWADELGRTSTLYVVGMDADGNFGKVNTLKFKVKLAVPNNLERYSDAFEWNRTTQPKGDLLSGRTAVATSGKAPIPMMK